MIRTELLTVATTIYASYAGGPNSSNSTIKAAVQQAVELIEEVDKAVVSPVNKPLASGLYGVDFKKGE